MHGSNNDLLHGEAVTYSIIGVFSFVCCFRLGCWRCCWWLWCGAVPSSLLPTAWRATASLPGWSLWHCGPPCSRSPGWTCGTCSGGRRSCPTPGTGNTTSCGSHPDNLCTVFRCIGILTTTPAGRASCCTATAGGSCTSTPTFHSWRDITE